MRSICTTFTRKQHYFHYDRFHNMNPDQFLLMYVFKPHVNYSFLLERLQKVSILCLYTTVVQLYCGCLVPSWLRRISSSSLATTILSLSPLSMTKMMAWLSLRRTREEVIIDLQSCSCDVFK